MIDTDALTLEELSAKVQERLQAMGLLEAQADGRVAAAPDARTVRYYGTLGLLDRPRLVEREARYGERHVLQLVAIKALQAAGLPLADVQRKLYGLRNSGLETLLDTVTTARPAKSQTLRAVRWQEVTIEPGVKLLVEEGWSPRTSPAALEDRLRAALAALAGIGGLKS